MENKIYKDTLITEQGYEAANKAANGQGSFIITRVVASDNQYSGKSNDELRQLTSLDNEVGGQILDQNNVNTKLTAIKTNFTNEIKTDGYVARTIGFYAKYPNGAEFLYSVTPSENGQIVPALSSNVFSGFELIVYVLVGNVQKMDVNLSPGGDASIDFVNKVISKTSDSLTALINNRVIDNKDGSINVNGNRLSINSTLDKNADIFKLPPGVYKSEWGYQTTLKNFPSPNGAAFIIVNGIGNTINNGRTIKVIDSWGGQYNTQWSNTAFMPWEQAIRKSDIDNINNAINNDIKNKLDKKVSFDGGKITTGNGTFVPADIDMVNSIASSAANFSQGKATSVADSLGNWIRSGFDSAGGSVAWLYTQNNQRIGDVASNAISIRSVADSLGNWVRSVADSTGGSLAWLYGQNNNNIGNINNVSNSVSAAVRSVADSAGTATRSIADSIGGSVAWLYTQNNARQGDVASASTAIRSVADSLGNWNRSGFDSVGTRIRTVSDSAGGSLAWLYTQNNQRIGDVASTATSIRSVADSLGNWNRSGFDSLGGSVTSLNNRMNAATNSMVYDNHNGTFNLNGYMFSVASSINPRGDVFKINGPGVYQSYWGYQDTLFNFPGGNGAAIIIAYGVPDNIYKLTVINSWGYEFASYKINGQFAAWKTIATP